MKHWEPLEIVFGVAVVLGMVAITILGLAGSLR